VSFKRKAAARSASSSRLGCGLGVPRADLADCAYGDERALRTACMRSNASTCSPFRQLAVYGPETTFAVPERNATAAGRARSRGPTASRNLSVRSPTAARARLKTLACRTRDRRGGLPAASLSSVSSQLTRSATIVCRRQEWLISNGRPDEAPSDYWLSNPRPTQRRSGCRLRPHALAIELD